MKIKLSYFCLLVGCVASASCYRIPDRPRNTDPNLDPNQTTLASQDQQRIEAQREQMKQREAARNQLKETEQQVQAQPETTTFEKPKESVSNDYQFANPVPGKEGFVFSPYNKKVIDVRGLPSGTLVQDPTYPASEKKYFRVP